MARSAQFNKHDPESCYGGFLRGRVAQYAGQQFIAVYVPSDALVAGAALRQFLHGVGQFPVPISTDALVISDNGDLYGTLVDLRQRLEAPVD